MKRDSLLLLIALSLLSICGLWQLWEQDIFWTIRCGGEFIKNGDIYCQQSWALDADFSHWLNIYWFTEPIFYSVNTLAGIKGLVFFRGVLIFLFLGGCVQLLKATNPKNFTSLSLILLPLIFMATAFRLQLRADFFAISLFPWFLTFVITCLKTSKGMGKIMLMIVLVMNLHSGVGLIFFASALIALVKKLTKERQFKHLGLLFVTPLLTPGHLKVFNLVLPTLAYENTAQLNNIDWQSFGLHLLFKWETGFSFVLFLFFNFVLIISLIDLAKKKSVVENESFFRPLLTVCFFLLLLTFFRFRSLPLLTVAILPLITPLLYRVYNKRPRLFAAIPLAFWGLLLPLFLSKFPYKWGLQISQEAFATTALEFINNQDISGPILHEPTTGNPMHYFIPDHKVFLDTREIIFHHLNKKLLAAGKSPERMRELLNEYEFNSILLPTTPARFDGTKWVSSQERFFPQNDWATIYFDDRYFVLLKRKAENASLIDELEFNYLRASHPAFFLPEDKNVYKELSTEISRCIEQTKGNYLCHAYNLFFQLQSKRFEQAEALFNILGDEKEKMLNYLHNLLPILKAEGKEPEYTWLLKYLKN